MKTQEEHIPTAGGSGHRSDEATEFSVEHPALDQEAICRLAYFFWEERGCPNDSPDEDWSQGRSRTSQPGRCRRITQK